MVLRSGRIGYLLEVRGWRLEAALPAVGGLRLEVGGLNFLIFSLKPKAKRSSNLKRP